MESEDEDEDAEELNVQSEKFNALHALYSSKTVVPFPSAPVLDNVAKATSLLSRNQDLINKPVQRAKKEVEPSTSANATEDVSGTDSGLPFSRRKPGKNVLTRMEETKGPLAYLRTCMEKRIRVKVTTRTARGIRGHCLGFVVAFDKHWNLVLEDVREVWTRPVKRKKYLLGQANEMPLAWKAMGPAVKPPKVVARRDATGMETCERHVSQMLMRDFLVHLPPIEVVPESRCETLPGDTRNTASKIKYTLNEQLNQQLQGTEEKYKTQKAKRGRRRKIEGGKRRR